MKSRVSAPASIPASTVTTLDDIASRDVVAPRVWWSTHLYWLFWVVLAAIVFYAVWSWAA
jgi:hypothetical protein